MRAARGLFAKKGMEECTIMDIANKAGVSPASVVVHFKSKTALLEEALNGDIENTLSELTSSLPAEAGLLDRLMHLARGFFGLYDGNRVLYRALVRSTVFEPSGETPGLTRQTEQYVHFLAKMVEEEKAHGGIAPEVDSTVAAISIFSLYMGAVIMLFRMPEMPVEAVAETLASMTGQYLKGIQRKGR